MSSIRTSHAPACLARVQEARHGGRERAKVQGAGRRRSEAADVAHRYAPGAL